MFPDLNAPLEWSHKAPPAGQCVLLTDTGGADASFLINHFIGLHLRAGLHVCLVGLSQSSLHYSAIARKLGHPIDSKFIYIDAMTQLLCSTTRQNEGAEAMEVDTSSQNTSTFSLDNGKGLRALIETIDKALPTERSAGYCVIIDDLGLLVDVGVAFGDVLSFVAECHARFTSVAESSEGGAQRGGNVVILAHGLSSDPGEDWIEEDNDLMVEADEDDRSLARHMRYRADVVLAVAALPSGYSRDVHGQMTVERVACGNALPVIDKLHFKTKDNGVAFFAPGTSSAVL
eukprot:m.46535 g.46535  ORF g.46535 m.46535 type:complete len:288 (-) comp6775_c0_seq1:80-943(-)